MFAKLFFFLFLLKLQSFNLPSLFHYISEKRHIHISLLREFEKLCIKQVKLQARIKFLSLCLNFEVFPKFLSFRIPSNGVFNKSSISAFQLNVLSKEIKKCRAQSKFLSSQFSSLKYELQNKCSFLQFFHLNNLLQKSSLKVKSQIENIHNKK